MKLGKVKGERRLLYRCEKALGRIVGKKFDDMKLLDFRRYELFVAGVYRGLAGFVTKNRRQTIVESPQGEEAYIVKVEYIREMIFLIHPSGVVDETVVRRSVECEKVPRKKENYSFDSLTSSIDLEYYIESMTLGKTFNGKMNEIGQEAATNFHSSSAQLPSCLLALMSNLAATTTTDTIVPIYLSQPDMNNRNVNINHVYSRDNANLEVRSDDSWGTLETAWGKSPFDMSAVKAVAVFYEVRLPEMISEKNPDEKSPAKQFPDEPHPDLDSPAKLFPSLNTIVERKLIGDPIARRLRLQSAKSFWMLMSGQNADEVFGETLKSYAKKQEEVLAQCLVIATLNLMRLRFNSLKKDKDWLHLYYHLEHLLKTKFTYGSDKIQIFSDDRPHPKTMLEVRKGVWSMINFLTPIRIAFLDAQRRIAGCIYAMMQTYPESSLEDLKERMDAEDDKEYMTEKEPDETVLSQLVTTEFLIPCVQSNLEDPNHDFSPAELKLCKQHSQFIQRSTSVARKRSMSDALLSLCTEIRNAGLAISAELVYRKETPKDFHAIRSLRDFEKNEKHISRIHKFVLKELMKDSSEGFSTYCVNAFREVGKFDKANEASLDSDVMEEGGTPQFSGNVEERVESMLETNRMYLEEQERLRGMFTRQKAPGTRTELNMFGILFGNFIHSAKSVESLMEIINVNGGSKAMDIIQDVCFENEDGLIMGSKDSNGKLYGVRAGKSLSIFQ